mgnify:CR=1 FL=1
MLLNQLLLYLEAVVPSMVRLRLHLCSALYVVVTFLNSPVNWSPKPINLLYERKAMSFFKH